MPVQILTPAAPIVGKTYSLYGNESSSAEFYDQLCLSGDLVLKNFNGREANLLSFLSRISTSKRRIRSYERKDPVFSNVMNILRRDLKKYLHNVEWHLKSITIRQRWDKRLSTSEDQYLLYMLEIEMTNRINLNRFAESSRKLAFLPHCLRDFSRECLAAPDGIDYLCKGCSKICTVNKISRLLKENKVTPYIWLQADLKNIFRMYIERSETPGVVGVACIPELANGMRLCRKYNIPVVGVPLDANRCRRWMGEFFDTSVNIQRLGELIH